MATVPDDIHPGDIIIKYDWRLHATGAGRDENGPYVETTEFPGDHLHLGASVDLAVPPIPADEPCIVIDRTCPDCGFPEMVTPIATPGAVIGCRKCLGAWTPDEPAGGAS